MKHKGFTRTISGVVQSPSALTVHQTSAVQPLKGLWHWWVWLSCLHSLVRLITGLTTQLNRCVWFYSSFPNHRVRSLLEKFVAFLKQLWEAREHFCSLYWNRLYLESQRSEAQHQFLRGRATFQLYVVNFNSTLLFLKKESERKGRRWFNVNILHKFRYIFQLMVMCLSSLKIKR